MTAGATRKTGSVLFLSLRRGPPGAFATDVTGASVLAVSCTVVMILLADGEEEDAAWAAGSFEPTAHID